MNVVAMRPWGSAFFGHVKRHVPAFQGLPPHIHRAIVEAYVKGALISDIAETDFAGLVVPWLSSEGAISFYRQFEQADEAFTAEIEPDFGKIDCGADIIWGTDDPWIPLARGRALHVTMPNARFHMLAQVGHLPQMEAPERLLQMLENILRQ